MKPTRSISIFGFALGLTILALLILGTTFSQAETAAEPETQWVRMYGLRQFDVGTSIFPVSDGGYIAAGYTVDQGARNNDVWVLKLDAVGNTEWQKTYDAGGIEEVRNIIEIPGQGYLIAVNRAGGIYAPSRPWILRTDTRGVIQWQKSYSIDSYYENRLAAVKMTPDGGFILTGNSRVSEYSTHDAWAIKIAADGQVVWKKTYDDSYYDVILQTTVDSSEYALNVTTTADGGFLLVGQIYQSYGFSSYLTDGVDGWVLKIDGAGNPIWQQAYQMPVQSSRGEEQFMRVIELHNGDFILAGYHSKAYTINSYGRVGWLVRIKPTGEVIWQRSYFIPATIIDGNEIFGSNEILGVSETSSGDLIVVGRGNLNWARGWAARLTASGEFVWQKLTSAYVSNYDGFLDVAMDSADNILITGGVFNGNYDDLVIAKFNADGIFNDCTFFATNLPESIVITHSFKSLALGQINSKTPALSQNALTVTPTTTNAQAQLVCGVEPPKGIISGKVVNSQGAPLQNVRVEISSSLVMTTTESGLFNFPILNAGNYTLIPELANYVFSPPSKTVQMPGFSGSIVFTGTETLDLAILEVKPIQVIEDVDLVLNKSTAVKVVVSKIGAYGATNVGLSLTYNGNSLTTFYVADLANRYPEDHEQRYALMENNLNYPLSFDAGREITKTVYFIAPSLMPTVKGSYQVGVVIDPSNSISEITETNNQMGSDPLVVNQMIWEDDIAYFGIDWPDQSFPINYTQAAKEFNNFMEAVYPVADGKLKSINYQTNSKPSDLTKDNFDVWFYGKASSLRILYPTIERFVGVLPPGWLAKFEIPAKGFKKRNISFFVLAEANPESATVAHELGHSWGLPARARLFCQEEYSVCYKPNQGILGALPAEGILVARRLPIDFWPKDLWPLRRLISYMGAYVHAAEPDQYKPVYSSSTENYQKLYQDHQENALQTPTPAQQPGILISGWIDITGTVTLGNWYKLPNAIMDFPRFPGPYVIDYFDAHHTSIFTQTFGINFDYEDITNSISPFLFTLPYLEGVTNITLSYEEQTIISRTISANAPILTLLSPQGSTQYRDPVLRIEWQGQDLDNDPLFYSLFLSDDSGQTWDVLEVETDATYYDLDLSERMPGQEYVIKVIVTDGVNSSVVDSAPFSFQPQVSLYLPLIVR